MHSEELLRQVAMLPSLPGVYRFSDSKGQLLYVGKARNLRKRVTSYFHKDHAGTRIGHMVGQIHSLETTVVRTEAEALLLENNLIKVLHPKFNILFRDDKSYPYLKISPLNVSNTESLRSKDIARISYFRGAIDSENRFFGPYPSAWAVKESIQLIQKIFKIRTCEDAIFDNRSRPCLLFQIKRCSAPCVGLITAEAYRADVASAIAFLEGDVNKVLASLRLKMLAYSEALEFERAAEVRDQMNALSAVLHQQAVDTNEVKDIDVIAIVVKGGYVCINLAMIRGGRHLGDKAFFPSQLDAALQVQIDSEGVKTHNSIEKKVLEAFLMQHYLSVPMPNLIVCNEIIDKDLISFLEVNFKARLNFVFQPKSHRKIWLNMAIKNAEIQLSRYLLQVGSQKMRTHSLIEILDVDIDDAAELKVECFDISHTSGENTKASCVVFASHQMQPSQYRIFNINGITPGDDYAAMEQVLLRRYKDYSFLSLENTSELSLSAKKMPDIVLIDGGKGQVEVARKVFTELGLDTSKIVGVEKGEGRKVGLEELVFADGRRKISLEPDSPALMLIAQIRDEAHRFAITGMRAARSKVRVGGGVLEGIPGVGPKKRALLLQRFGGIRGVTAASIEDLMSVDGISAKLAEDVYRALH